MTFPYSWSPVLYNPPYPVRHPMDQGHSCHPHRHPSMDLPCIGLDVKAEALVKKGNYPSPDCEEQHRYVEVKRRCRSFGDPASIIGLVAIFWIAGHVKPPQEVLNKSKPVEPMYQIGSQASERTKSSWSRSRQSGMIMRRHSTGRSRLITTKKTAISTSKNWTSAFDERMCRIQSTSCSAISVRLVAHSTHRLKHAWRVKMTKSPASSCLNFASWK